MMRLACLLACVLVTFSAVECTRFNRIQRVKRNADFVSGTCDSTQTQIYTRTIHTQLFTKCPINTLVSRYFLPFLDECEHWMGTRPDHVATSNVYYCLEDPKTGGVKIKATVCCKGTLPANRCVTCSSSNPEDCDYTKGAVVTCGHDEVCQIQISCENNANEATIRKSCAKKPCAASSKSCKLTTYLEYGQRCSDCCDSALCNKGGLSLPCYRHCQCDQMVAGNYHCDSDGTCVCNDGCSGSSCSQCTATCNPNPCKNGGRCTDSGIISCCCKPGFGGKYCENKLPLCDRSDCSNHGECYKTTQSHICVCDPGYYGKTCKNIPDAFNCPSSKNIYFSDPAPYQTTCSNIVHVKLSKTSELGACRYYMKNQYGNSELFQEGKNGHVTELTAVGINNCQDGDCGLAYYQTKTCCPSCFSNPCQNGGYCLQTEQTDNKEDYVCRCKFGFTGKYCEKRVKTCFGFGEPHYITFDGQFITYQGVCRYILTQYAGNDNGLKPFTVYVKNEYRGSDHSISYPSYIEAYVAGFYIQLGRDNVVRVKRGNKEFKAISLNAVYNEFTIKRVGRFVRLETNFGLVVQFDGYNMMFVQIPDTYSCKLGGICNNMDGDTSNDLLDCTGVVRSDDGEGHTKYGDACLDPDYHSESESCKTEVPQSCNSEPYKTNDWCGYMINSDGPFSSCITSDSTMDFMACTYDVCRDQTSKCKALESFVEKCYKSGNAPDQNWREVTSCPMDCPAGAHYVFSGSACPRTCENPKANLYCEFDDTEVCQCNNDTMLFRDGKCVPIAKCGCKDSDNVRHEVNDIWEIDLDSCQHKKCVACVEPDCALPGKIITEPTDQVVGGWSEWEQWSPCSTDSKKTRSRKCDNPVPACGGSGCGTEKTQVAECSIIPPSTIPTTTAKPKTPPKPICEKNFDFSRACGQCDRTRNPNMYIANPCGCESYYQCRIDQFGGYQVTEMPCNDCTCWNQTILTCDHDRLKRNKNRDKCQRSDFPNEFDSSWGDSCTKYTDGPNSYRRSFSRVPNDYLSYIDLDTNIKMPCPPGTQFSLDHCGCIHGGITRRAEEFMCLTFDDKENPYKTTTGIWVSPSETGLYPGESGKYGFGLRFDGGNLEIPAFNNKEINRMTVSLWYKRDRPSYSGVQALMSNDDCTQVDPASFQILSASLTQVRGGVRTLLSNILSDLFYKVADDRNWHHVAMTYDMDTKKAEFYLNGNLMMTKTAEGSIPGSHCPMLIGSKYSGNYFHGVMDQICFYDEAFSATEVMELSRPNLRRGVK